MSDDIQLGGWDTAIAMRYGDINDKIASMVAADRTKNGAKAAFPAKIDISNNDLIGNTTSIKGDATDAWRLTAGGDGSNIMILVNVTNVEIQFPTLDATGARTTKDIKNAKVKILVKAKLIGQPDGSYKIGKRNSAGLTDITYTFASSKDSLDSLTKVTFDTHLNTWISDHLGAFTQIITKIDPNNATNNPNWDWLIPKVSQALVSEVAGRADEDQILVIRSMTTSTNAPVVGTLSGKLIPDGIKGSNGKVAPKDKPTVGFIINPSLFLEKMIRPSLYILFDGATEGDFRVTGSKIVTKKTFTIKNFHPTEGDGKNLTDETVAAEFSDFKVEIVGDRLEFSAGIKFPYKSVVLTTSYRSVMSIKKGTKTITITPTDKTKKPFSQTITVAEPENEVLAATHTKVTANASLSVASYITGAAVIVLGAIISSASIAAGDDDPPSAGNAVANGGNNEVPLADMQNDVPDQVQDDDDNVNDPMEDGARNKPRKLYFKRTGKYWAKTVGVGFGSLIIGGGAASIPVWIKIGQDGLAKKVDDDLDVFMEHMLKVADMPQGPAQSYELVNVQIAGTLVFGARLKGS